MEKQLIILTKNYNVKLQDMTEIDLGFGIEVAEKLIMPEGFNPYVPKRNGRAIYQGEIRYFQGKSFDECLNKAIKELI